MEHLHIDNDIVIHGENGACIAIVLETENHNMPHETAQVLATAPELLRVCKDTLIKLKQFREPIADGLTLKELNLLSSIIRELAIVRDKAENY